MNFNVCPSQFSKSPVPIVVHNEQLIADDFDLIQIYNENLIISTLRNAVSQIIMSFPSCSLKRLNMAQQVVKLLYDFKVKEAVTNFLI